MSRKSYEGSPSVTLNAISRDPVIFWGCSLAELKKGALIMFLFIFLPLCLMFSFIHFALGILMGFIGWFIACRLFFANLAKKRSDRPLFFDQHLSKKKKHIFIAPNTKFQRIKNTD